MFKQTLIATATAGLIALGGLGATTTAASAASIQFGGPNWNVQIGNGYPGPRPFFHEMRPKPVCTPVTRTVKWWDHWNRPHWTVMVVGQTCTYPGQGNWNKGPGNWNGNGGNWNGNGPGNGGNWNGNGGNWH